MSQKAMMFLAACTSSGAHFVRSGYRRQPLCRNSWPAKATGWNSIGCSFVWLSVCLYVCVVLSVLVFETCLRTSLGNNHDSIESARDSGMVNVFRFSNPDPQKSSTQAHIWPWIVRSSSQSPSTSSTRWPTWSSWFRPYALGKPERTKTIVSMVVLLVVLVLMVVLD